MYHIRLLEKFEFFDIIISLKSSNVKMMVEAYRKISSLVDYPLHLGVTEAGTKFQGTVKSAIGIGALLVDGIGIEIISCPTCGRTEIDLIGLAKQVEKEFETEKNKFKIAVMGCVVNGPGEAREADYGIAAGRGIGILFKKGEIVKKVSESDLLEELKKMINEDLEDKKN